MRRLRLRLVGIDVGLEGFDLRQGTPPPLRHLVLQAHDGVPPLGLGAARSRLFVAPGRSGQCAAFAEIGLQQLNAAARHHELADLVGMGDAARLEQIKFAVELAVGLAVEQQDPAVHQRRQTRVGFGLLDVGEMREHGGDAVGLEGVDDAQQHRLHLGDVGRAGEGGDRIEHDQLRLEPVDLAQHDRKMHLEGVEGRARREIAQLPVLQPFGEICADRPHVANGLRLGLLEREIERALAAPAGSIRHHAGQRGSCRSRRRR